MTSDRLELLKLLEEQQYRRDRNRLPDYKPYQKQIDFHAAGLSSRESLLMAANQSGKTYSAAAEVAMHLTCKYPGWWCGRRIDRPNHWLAGSESGELTRRGVQRMLLGRDIKSAMGTGMIPGVDIVGVTMARGVADLCDTVKVRHESGGVSTISFKSYDQGRSKWQADTVDGVWFDEEPPEDVYFEGLTRTNAVMGRVMMTFTPLQGMSKVVHRYLVDRPAGTSVTTMTIEDAGHYTPEQRAAIIASYPAHERDARALGIPSMGSGLIFPVSDILIDPIKIPDFWPQIVGLDFGWDHPTAAARLAWDRDNDVVYLTAEYRAREVVPAIVATAIKAWGAWIPVSWPHDGLQHDKGSGDQLAAIYKGHGLNMLAERATHPDGSNGVEAGIQEMLERMMTGRFKVFNTCPMWDEERRMYHRKDGKIIKQMDDIISASRYAHMMLRKARVRVSDKPKIAEWHPLDSGMGY